MTVEGNNENDASRDTEIPQNKPVPSATTRDWRMFNVVLLGIAFLFVFVGFFTCSMVQVCDVQFLPGDAKS